VKLLSHLAATGFVGAIGAAVVLSSPFEAGTAHAALWGVAVGTGMGLLVLVLKARVVAHASTPQNAMLRALAAQVGGLLGRMLVLGLSLVAVSQLGAPVPAFAFAFLGMFFGQQLVELRYMASAHRGVPQGT